MDAIDDLGDALETTRNFLTPVRAGLWLKLAFVVFFVSSLGMGGSPAVGGDFAAVGEEPAFEDDLNELVAELNEELETDVTVEEIVTALLIVGAILLGIWLIYAAIAGIMEFVFLESLRSGEVHVRRYFGANLGKGIRLFLFRIGLVIVVGALATIPFFAFVWDGGIGALSNGQLASYFLYGFGLFLVYAIVTQFTDEFVAPIMLLEDRGVLGAWRRFLGTLTANWTEYAVYLVIVWILYLAVSIAVGIVVGLGLLAIAIPFVIVVFLLLLAGSVGALFAFLVALLGLAVALLFVALVWTPIVTYFQYYALLLLGDTNDEFDLIPDQRDAVRAGDDRARDRDSDWADDDAEPWDDSSGWDGADDRDGSSGWDGADDPDDRDDDRSW